MENRASSREKARSPGAPRVAASEGKPQQRNASSGETPSKSPKRQKASSQKSDKKRNTNVTSSHVKPICQFFQRTGTCKFGDNCRFSHDVRISSRREASSSASASSSQQNAKKTKSQLSTNDFRPICNFFAKTGTCKYGDNCRFSHDAKNASKRQSPQSARSSTAASPQASMDVTQFIQRIENIVRRPNATLKLDHQHDLDLWKQAWSAVAVGAELSSGSALLAMLMRLPASSTFLPSLPDVLRTLARIGQYTAETNVPDKVRLKTFELIADVYEHRLRGREGTISASLRGVCIEKTAALRANMHTGLMKAIGSPKTAERASKLLIRSLTLFDRFISDLKGREGGKEEERAPNNELDSWSGWRNATVGWLQRASWLNATQLHKEYESVEHYAETLCALMTALAFFWGAGAMFPKCRVRRDGANACDQPLHVQIHTANNLLCGQKLPNRQTCTGKATWRCVRHGHDHICERCLQRTQEVLVGEPGPRASTDIYDAVVERETTRRDGIVYIASKLESRKPPAITPNWRTTYRLNCSALVGIVRLGASCEPLSSQSRVEWAEIVPVSPQAGPASDFNERARGRIALRLLTRADLSTLAGTWEALRPGSRIAVIDLQVFVPEVVSVLSALTDPGLVDHMHHIQFWPQLVGNSRADEMQTPGSNVSEVIRFALDNTQMDLINRLEPSTKSQLCEKITNLARQTNLSGTQLQAFAAALSNSLHCTQGPPGTGKSYLGVVLIRALDLIRRVAVRSGNAVGPIVVLSYKNHALDEILGDLIDTRQWSGAIIRCGKTEDHRLASSMERKSKEEQKAQKVLTERVATLRRTRRIMRDIRALSSAFADETGISLHSWMSSLKIMESDESELSKRWVLEMLRFFLYRKRFDEEITSEEAYNLLRRTMRQESEMGIPSVHDCELFSVMPGLRKGTEHWFTARTDQFYFLLGEWLAGSKPPPRCAAAECLFASEREGAFCKELHGCCLRGCFKRRIEDLYYCEGHRCRYQDAICKLPRMEGADICQDHACIYCLEYGIVPVLSKSGATACKNHSCQVDGCANVFLAPALPFCTRHCCRLCFQYARTDPDFVKSAHRVGASQFCIEHKCSVRDCENNRDLRHTPQLYCIHHGCMECSGIRQVIDFAMPESGLCPQHRCANILDGQLCGLRRVNDSKFCDAHTCRFCREEGLSLEKLVVDWPPRNVCSHHRLCEHLTSSGETCNERVSSSSAKYCEKHQRRGRSFGEYGAIPSIKMQCEGITSKGRRCRATRPCEKPPFYCIAHEAQKPDSESESETESESGDGSYASDGPEQRLQDGIFKDVESEAETLGTGGDDKLQQPGNNDPGELVLGKGTVETFSMKKFVTLDGDPLTDEPVVRSDGIGNTTELSEHGVKPDLNVVASGVPSQGPSALIEERAPDVRESQGIVTAKELEPEQPSEGFAHNNDVGDINAERDAMEMSQDHIVDEADGSSTDSESSEEEIADQMRHLRDIVDIASASGSDSDVEDSAVPVLSHGCQGDSISAAPEDWDWNLPLIDRWRHVASFLEAVLASISAVAETADSYVECSRRELAEAAAYSFKSARVIGATVIGATRRLHALRASEPFAMIVEEACEVLEPTLVSVLSVRSLRKLELIGDHRQLPAYVQPCWFSVQVANPSIEVSLFERLVLNDPSSCTVLDVQRRMRPFICDLTRCEYDDIVCIEDFATTKTQLIGDKLGDFRFIRHLAKWQAEERDLWFGKGAIVPGVKPQVFFWDLPTKEGRAAVGLSRCNYGEADACVALAHWLVYSGVPPGCITIITPYKDDRVKRIFVSTVDRYQGDENDIVILSLVSTRPGNRFVALRNRFIVSLSRARIGLYVIGSSEAVSKNAKGGEGPTHWCRLLRDLNITSGLVKDPVEASGNIGPQLSIRCPRHDDVSRNITGAEGFPIGAKGFKDFCSEPCRFNLPWCGHNCALPCHSPKEVVHRTECSAAVPRPCPSHSDVPLQCHEVRLKALDSNNLTEGLLGFECEVPVLYSRPECSHSVELKCHEYKKIKSGEVLLRDCSEKVDDYVNPSCGHKRKKPTCHNRRMWEKEPPACHVLVAHERPCGCKARMTCEDSVKELSLENAPACLEAVAKPRPRCSHVLSSRCYEATSLREVWSQQDGEAISRSPPIVLHGVQYGPSETELGRSHAIRDENDFPECLIKILYRRSCGHTMMVRCADAFQLAKDASKEGLCVEEVVQTSPFCGHEIKTACHFKAIIDSQPPSLFVSRVDDETGEMETIADEGAIESAPPFNPRVKKLGALCGGSFVVQRKCGHKTNKLRCAELYSLFRTKRLPPCKTKMNLRMSCGHFFSTMCHRQGEPYPDCQEPVEDVFVYSSCKRLHSVRPGVCSELQRLQALESPQCPVMIKCRRSRCSHEVEVPCHLEKLVTSKFPGNLITEADPVVQAGVYYCDLAVGVNPCNEPVTFRRLCGHEETNVPCSRAFEWASDPQTAPPCRVVVETVSPLCQHAVNIECRSQEAISQLVPWDDAPPSRISIAFDGQNEFTSPVVIEGIKEPNRIFDARLPECAFTTRLQRVCGHEEDVKCNIIFAALESPCEQTEVITCDDCGRDATVPCHKLENESAPYLCQALVEKMCSTCNINFAKVECFKKTADCAREVTGKLPCGHEVKWTCGEEDPRLGFRIESCLFCVRESYHSALADLQAITIKDPTDESSSKDNRKGSDLYRGRCVFDSKALLQSLITRVKSMLPPESIVELEELGPINENALVSAQTEMLERHIDLYTEAMNSGEFSVEDLEVQKPPQLTDALNSYDIVYMVPEKEERAIDCFRMRDCQYGYGATVSVLCEEAIAAEYSKAEAHDGIILSVAAVLKLRGLKDVQPFRPPLNQLKKKGLRKTVLRARKRGFEKIMFGYDHVHPVANPFGRVYWIADAIMPIVTMKVRPMRACGICMDDMLPVKGWLCPNDHFLCRECFSAHVEAGKAPDALARNVDGDGHILCPQPKCDAKFDSLHLLGQKHDASEEELREMVTSLQQLRMERHTNREVQAALHVQKTRLEAEFARIQQIEDGNERRAETLRVQISEDILTLRCPNKKCRMAFMDFDGCFALAASRRTGCAPSCGELSGTFCSWSVPLAAGVRNAPPAKKSALDPREAAQRAKPRAEAHAGASGPGAEGPQHLAENVGRASGHIAVKHMCAP
ncbi:DNA2/NAM7 helicase [Gracilaria domingensis]|nr:DNA2/NAM7 helicase [Gracilaria domingensis]